MRRILRGKPRPADDGPSPSEAPSATDSGNAKADPQPTPQGSAGKASGKPQQPTDKAPSAAKGAAPIQLATAGPQMPPPPALPQVAERPVIRGPVWVGAVILIAFFGGVGGWAVFAPLSSAAVAPGVVAVDSNRKTIQHLEGGIIKTLMIRNGDVVAPGDLMLRLEDTQARAGWNLMHGQHDAQKALESRLIAERDGAEKIAFPAAMEVRRAQPDVAEILGGQQTIFEARRRSLTGQVNLLHQQVDQLKAEIDSRRSQYQAAKQQKKLIREEIKSIQILVNKGLERKPRLLALQRESANLDGNAGEQLGLIARAQQQIGEIELKIIDHQNSYLNKVVAELREVQTSINDVEERMISAKDVLSRMEIRAPLGGVVVDLKFFTPGGVIAPGAPIADIIPQNDKLIVEAQVQPLDIDIVKVGLPARVTLSAFKQRTTPTLDGTVIYVSADSLVDKRTGAPYFSARVEISKEQLDRIDDVELSPGMPADVMIVTGSRTAFQYLFDPLRESMRRAFREQ